MVTKHALLTIFLLILTATLTVGMYGVNTAKAVTDSQVFEIVSPINKIYYTNNVTIIVNFNTSYTNATYTLDDGELQQLTIINNTATTDLVLLDEGTHRVNVTLYDDVDEVVKTELVKFSVDTTSQPLIMDFFVVIIVAVLIFTIIVGLSKKLWS